VAIDATGLETSTASAHFVTRSKKERKKWVKLSVAVLTTSLLPLGAVLDWGPNNDKCQVWPLLQQSLSGEIKPSKLYADAGYDPEWVHGVCREEFGVATTVIKPARCAKDGSRRGEYRSRMSPEYLQSQRYGLRWKIESYMSQPPQRSRLQGTGLRPQSLGGSGVAKLFNRAEGILTFPGRFEAVAVPSI
jgi:hypothetical protein